MISNISITGLVATCLIVGSNASPCRASSRTTQISNKLTTKITSTATGTTSMTSDTTDTTENTALSTTELSSTQTIHTTGLSGTALLSTEQLTITVTESASGTETSSNPEKPTTTTTATAEPTSTVAESAITSVESTATSHDSTTTESATTNDDSTPTAEPITTTEVASTTTTVEAPAGPTFIANAGFEDSSESISPWNYFTPNAIRVSIDTNVRYDGQNSARMDFLSGQGSFIRQPLQGLLADVSYTMSAWVQPDTGCSLVLLRCTFSNSQIAKRGDLSLRSVDANTWQQASGTCSYTQAQIDSGNLYLIVGLSCTPGSRCYIDSTRFTQSLA